MPFFLFPWKNPFWFLLSDPPGRTVLPVSAVLSVKNPFARRDFLVEIFASGSTKKGIALSSVLYCLYQRTCSFSACRLLYPRISSFFARRFLNQSYPSHFVSSNSYPNLLPTVAFMEKASRHQSIRKPLFPSVMRISISMMSIARRLLTELPSRSSRA